MALRGLRVGAEVAVGASRRADLLVHSPRGQGVAIEIQHSPISLAEVRQRTADHGSVGLATLWLPVIDLAAVAPRRVPGAGHLLYCRTSLPLWIEWVAERAGALWFWHRDALWQGWIDLAWTPLSHSACPVGSDDCGWQPSRRLRSLTLEGPIRPRETRLLVQPARTAPDTRFAPLAGRCATLVRAGEAAPRPCPTVIDWMATPTGVRPAVRLVAAPRPTRH